ITTEPGRAWRISSKPSPSRKQSQKRGGTPGGGRIGSNQELGDKDHCGADKTRGRDGKNCLARIRLARHVVAAGGRRVVNGLFGENAGFCRARTRTPTRRFARSESSLEARATAAVFAGLSRPGPAQRRRGQDIRFHSSA